MAMRPHLTEEEIALLVEGSIKDSGKKNAFEHLRSCQQCFEDYKDAAIGHGIWVTEQDFFGQYPELVSAGLKIAENDSSIGNQSRKDSDQSNSRLRKLRPLAVAVCAVLVIAAAVWIPGRFDRQAAMPEEPKIFPEILAVAELASSNSKIVFPGTEDSFNPDLPAYRAGIEYDDYKLSSSLTQLVERYNDNRADRNDLFWLATGYLADGQLIPAEQYINIARAQFRDDQEIAVLNALLFYLDGDLSEAERILREVYRTDSEYAVAQFNLGVVLLELGEASEARILLEDLQNHHPNTLLARRAGKLLGKN